MRLPDQLTDLVLDPLACRRSHSVLDLADQAVPELAPRVRDRLVAAPLTLLDGTGTTGLTG